MTEKGSQIIQRRKLMWRIFVLLSSSRMNFPRNFVDSILTKKRNKFSEPTSVTRYAPMATARNKGFIFCLLSLHVRFVSSNMFGLVSLTSTFEDRRRTSEGIRQPSERLPKDRGGIVFWTIWRHVFQLRAACKRWRGIHNKPLCFKDRSSSSRHMEWR